MSRAAKKPTASKPSPEQVFKRLYDSGVQLRIGDDGRLKVSHVSADGCKEEEKKLIRAYAKDLAHLLDDSKTADRFSTALTFVGEQLTDAPEERHADALSLLDDADEAYQQEDYGRARWLLLCAATAARRVSEANAIADDHDRASSVGAKQEVLA